MKDFKRLLEILIFWICISLQYLFYGLKKRRFLPYLKNYIREFFLHIEMFSKFLQEYKDFEELQSSKQIRLKESANGLHQLLSQKKFFSYSILIFIDPNSSLSHIKNTLESSLNLTAPHLEILLGHQDHPDPKVLSYIETKKIEFPFRLKNFTFENSLTSSAIINALAEHSKGDYLFLMQVGDWARPDLLYRYEQTLHFSPQDANKVLFCEEYLLDSAYAPIPRTLTHKPQSPCFPYVFNDQIGNTLLIPKNLWKKIQGLDEAAEGAHAFDLPLRLDEAGAVFEKIPVALYAVLQECKIKRDNFYETPEISKLILRRYERYAKNKKLDWHWEKGFSKKSVRALPTLSQIPKVHAIILYKNQSNLTLSAVRHLCKQVGVEVKITAIDNQSSDSSIAEKLRQMGVEVIRIEEPFNYSRLNNLAVLQSQIGHPCDSILFLNNDVDLECTALLEMCRWIEQPGIGLVGCRLNYPNGLLQHGGVIIESSRAAFIKSWHHEERTEKFARLENTNYLRICAAVTAACCLIKRKTFLDVQGFDEVWYPVAFSDTALAVKIRSKGLHCFYTPFAVGIHHESISRKKVNIEDYESLTWTHRKFVQNLMDDKKVHFKDLINTEY